MQIKESSLLLAHRGSVKTNYNVFLHLDLACCLKLELFAYSDHTYFDHLVLICFWSLNSIPILGLGPFL